jgi:hypothetical protein
VLRVLCHIGLQDIDQNPQAAMLKHKPDSRIQKVTNMSNKYLDGWRKYCTVYSLCRRSR